MNSIEDMALVFNWNRGFDNFATSKQILDTSLRDGLQDPAIIQPTLEEKLKFVQFLSDVGIDAADIGFPANSEEHKAEVIKIAQHIRDNRLNIRICVLARTQLPDIEAAIDVAQKAQAPVEAIIIVGSSKVRHFVERWDIYEIERRIKGSIKLALNNGLEVNFLTEDGTRTEPEIIRRFYSLAIEQGATRVTIADTVGSITPLGTRKIIHFLKNEIIKDDGIKIDWHGHNDRDLATANSLAALEAGADRVHSTVLGIGERAGNTAMASILLNLQILGMANKKLTKLPCLSEYASKIFNVPIPTNHPGIGSSVHTTSVGIHAAAILKAKVMGRSDIANTVYSGVDARMFDRDTEIVIGPLSGESNVLYVLRKLGVEPHDALVNQVLNLAKSKNAVLKDDEILEIIKSIES